MRNTMLSILYTSKCIFRFNLNYLIKILFFLAVERVNQNVKQWVRNLLGKNQQANRKLDADKGMSTSEQQLAENDDKPLFHKSYLNF